MVLTSLEVDNEASSFREFLQLKTSSLHGTEFSREPRGRGDGLVGVQGGQPGHSLGCWGIGLEVRCNHIAKGIAHTVLVFLKVIIRLVHCEGRGTGTENRTA